MPDTSNISLGLIGMNSDLSPTNLDEKSYIYCLNGKLEDIAGNGFGNLQNDASNILAISLPTGFKIIGETVIIEQDRAIVFLVNDNGLSLIVEYRNCSYLSKEDLSYILPCKDCKTPALLETKQLEKITQIPYCDYHIITSSTCLGFSMNHPVDIEYKLTDCGINIYFTDAFNERRFLYFDYTGGDINGNLVIQNRFLIISGFDAANCNQPIYTNILDCNKIKFHPDYEKPCIEIVDVVGGGQLKSGVYQALIAYSDVLGNELTSYSQASNPVPIKSKDITVVTDYQTNLAIKFRITNLDESGLFGYYNLVIAETIDEFTEFKLIGTYPTYTTNHTYGGNNLVKKLSASDIFYKRPYYQTSKSVTKANDYLFFSGLKEFPKYNLQPFAELVKLYWQTVAIEEPVYQDPKNTSKYRAYMRDEVYPLGLVFTATNGEELCVIHIPGPSKTYLLNKYGINVDTIINTNDVIADTTCDISPRNKLWEVYNTANVVNTTHQPTLDCNAPNIWEYGEFGYHESTELYPNNPLIWGDLCGKPIRHFRFPDNSVTHIHDGLTDSKKYADNNQVFPLGVKIDATSVTAMLNAALAAKSITQAQYDRIDSYRLVRGNRVGNKSVVAKGLLYDVWDYSKDSKKYYYSNYPYNDLRPDFFISNTADTYDTPDSDITDRFRNDFRPSGRYTFHSPDTHFTNPKIGSELKLETLEYGESEGYFNECQLQAKYKFLSTAATLLALSGGVAAALSTVDKECTTYTKKSDTKEKQDENGFDYIGTGGSYANTLTAGIVAEGTGTSGTNGSIDTHISASRQDTSMGTVREQYDNPYGENSFTPYNKTTGTTTTELPINVESYTKTTCTGTQYQELNKAGVLSLLTFGTGIGESVGGLIYKISLGLFEMKKIVELIEAIIPFKNFFLQYNSVGKYNNYRNMPNMVGNKRRLIDRSAYVNPQIQLINETSTTNTPTTINFNNWNRESTVYVKIKPSNTQLLDNPVVTDTSRISLGTVGGNYNSINQRYTAAISSYYGSIKNYVPDQYGNIFKIDYLETGSCPITMNSTSTTIVAFGGDTFITRFGLKRKMPFFLDTSFKLLDNADIRYQDLGNVGYPNFYLNSGGTVGENLAALNLGQILNPANLPTLFGVARNRLDVDSTSFFYQKGRIYLYNYGIPYFLVESDINTDYRHGIDNKEGDFYPNNSDLDTWLQEKNVPIRFDNTYYYNNTFSKQNHESFICINQADYAPDKVCKSDFSFRIIYSEQNQNNGSTYDNWLVFKANNYNDFPLTNGKLITADGIEDDKILVRFENTISVFAAYNSIQTDADNIQVGTGGIFKSRPKNYAISDLGYAGSQHRSIIKTEFGHVWADAKRGQVFKLGVSGQGLEELGSNGMKNWFKENLPFTLPKYFSNFNLDDIDNNFNGTGLHLCFDKKYSRMLMTKLDYKPLRSDIIYDNGSYYIHQDLPPITQTTVSCPPGYTLQGNVCVKETTTPAVFIGPNIPFIGTAKKGNSYSVLGSCIYSTYNVNGTGVFTGISLANPFWRNLTGTGQTGPLNRAGIWNSLSNDPIGEWLDISVRVVVPETKTYYIGIAADNLGRIKIGCDTLVQMDDAAMGVNHGVDNRAAFEFWHIYPVTLQAGVQYITLGGYNREDIASFGAEIYNNTAAEIAAATSYGDLNLVYTTNSLIGVTINTIGWVCNQGCETPIDNGDGTFSCVTVVNTDSITTTVEIPQSVDTKIELTDERYFCNKSWTISYNFLSKSWVSFHSFTPNVYIDWLTYFQTSDQLNIWSHNITNKSYQVYNGKLKPFIVELISKPQIGKSYLTNISYMLDSIRYHENVDTFYNDVINFNKAIVYNNKQCSGLLNLIVVDPEDFSNVGLYPKQTFKGIEVETHNAEGYWSVNDIFDTTTNQYTNLPFWINNCGNSEKELNPKAISYTKPDLDKAYLRNDYFKVRLINDKTSQYNFIFKYLINNSKKSS